MKITRPHAQDPTPEELAELEYFKHLLDQAAADGVITRQEIQNLQHQAYGQGTPTADQLYRELELYRQLVTEKVQNGELAVEPLGN